MQVNDNRRTTVKLRQAATDFRAILSWLDSGNLKGNFAKACRTVCLSSIESLETEANRLEPAPSPIGGRGGHDVE